MARSAEEHIPADVLAAARRGGLEDPLWYVGRSNGHENLEVELSIDDEVRLAEAKARGESPESSPGEDDEI